MGIFQAWWKSAPAVGINSASPEIANDVNSKSELSSPAQSAKDSVRAEDEALDGAQAALIASIPAAARVLLEPFAATSRRLETLLILGKTRFAEGDLDAACAVLLRAEELYPMDRRIWRTLAEIFATRGQFSKEMTYRRKMIYLVSEPMAKDYVAWTRSFILAAKENSPKSAQEVSIAIKNFPKAAGATQKLQFEFLELLYSVKKVSSQALASYQALTPLSDSERDTKAVWLDLPTWCERAAKPLHRCSVLGCGPKPIALAELSEVIVSPAFQWIPLLKEGSVALDGFVMHRVKTRRENPSSPLLMHNGKGGELRLQRSMRVVEQRSLLVGGMNQYYHNTIDFLSVLAVAEVFKVGNEAPLVVNEDLAPFQLEQLAALGYGEDRLIRIKSDEQVLFRDLVVPARLIRGGQWMHPLIPRWYRSRLVEGQVSGRPGRRLYVSRRKASRRRVTNDEEVANALSQLGFELICPEDMSFREQVDCFSLATHVVAPGGAALTNQIFMPPGSRVLGMTNRYVFEGLKGRDTYFDPLAQACGHHFAWVLGRAQEFHGTRLIDADYEVNIEELFQAVTKQMAGDPAPP